jgi:hypothetical protein
MKADEKIAQLRRASPAGATSCDLGALIEAMTLVILLARSEMGPRPWIKRAREIVREFEK